MRKGVLVCVIQVDSRLGRFVGRTFDEVEGGRVSDSSQEEDGREEGASDGGGRVE